MSAEFRYPSEDGQCVWLIDDDEDGEHDELQPHDFTGDDGECVNCFASRPTPPEDADIFTVAASEPVPTGFLSDLAKMTVREDRSLVMSDTPPEDVAAVTAILVEHISSHELFDGDLRDVAIAVLEVLRPSRPDDVAALIAEARAQAQWQLRDSEWGDAPDGVGETPADVADLLNRLAAALAARTLPETEETVATAEELDRLPEGAAILSLVGAPYVKTYEGWVTWFDRNPHPSSYMVEPWAVTGPFRVVFRPALIPEGSAD